MDNSELKPVALTVYHELLLAERCEWVVTADLGTGLPVAVMGVRAVGRDGYEVLTDYGWRRPVVCYTEQRVRVPQPDRQGALFV